MIKEIVVEDFGVVALPIYKGEVYTVPDELKENTDKADGFGWKIGRAMVPVDGLKQFVGGVRDEYDPTTAMRREIKEETKLSPRDGSVIPLNVSTLIYHKRPEDSGKYYGVDLYKWELSDEEARFLTERGAKPAEQCLDQMRERDVIVYQLYKQLEDSLLPVLLPIMVNEESML